MRALVDFLLNDWLDAAALARRPRHEGQGPDDYARVLDAAERLARERFAPFNRQVDVEEPRFDGTHVVLPQASKDAWDAYAESGLLAATQDAEWGGAQLPLVVAQAAQAFFAKASVSIHAGLLTVGNANLLLAHGTPAQREAFARRELAGIWAGTMALSEPQAGSSLSDIVSRAEPDGVGFEDDPLGPRYRLHGSKMWISNGDHELTDNIVHLVLAKIPDADGRLPAGTRGISLFVCPKWLVDSNGNPTGERNDVVLAGLNHKLGWRGTPNTLLNFGEGRWQPRGQGGAIAWRVGPEGKGLACMFHMMNEARIAIGLAAAMLGRAGYEASLAYARERRQGRPAQGAAATSGPAKDVHQQPVRLIEHADIRRMLLAQKAYADGALALVLYGARLVDEQRTGGAAAARRAGLLLEVLTPIIKSFPSEWCLEGNSLAIQVLGGAGYTRDFPVEQYWRDQRLNMIHEGTHGIQAMDLLGRKMVMDGGAGLALLAETIGGTIDAAASAGASGWPELAAHATALRSALDALIAATRGAWAGGDAAAALANATPYLRGAGHVVWCWIWLDLALAAQRSGAGGRDPALRAGLRQACRHAFAHELPLAHTWLALAERRDDTALAMRDAWF